MEPLPSQEQTAQREEEYFEAYKVREIDLQTLQQGIDTLVESRLLEEGILSDIRFVTFDSKTLYILTRGEHASNDKFSVGEIPSSSKTGFRVFSIPHSGFIGKSKEDYRDARAWLLCDEVETTSVNAKKFPNENQLYEPELPQPERILDVVSIPPLEPYNKIQQGRFNYLTDVIFHEAGHIEHRRFKNWQEGEEPVTDFPSEEQKETFLAVIRQTEAFPKWAVSSITESINSSAIQEMYAMLIDREGARRYDVQRFNSENQEFERELADIQDQPTNQEAVERFRQSIQGGHTNARLLVRILEEQFPDIVERKRFVRTVLTRASNKGAGGGRI